MLERGCERCGALARETLLSRAFARVRKWASFRCGECGQAFCEPRSWEKALRVRGLVQRLGGRLRALSPAGPVIPGASCCQPEACVCDEPVPLGLAIRRRDVRVRMLHAAGADLRAGRLSDAGLLGFKPAGGELRALERAA